MEEAVAPLVADVRRTLKPDFEVQIVIDGGVWMWSTCDSARSIGEAEWYVEDDGPEDLAQLVVKLAYEIPDFDFVDVLEPWPPCPHHEDHPLYPRLRGGEPSWVCPDAGGGPPICRIGELEGSPRAR